MIPAAIPPGWSAAHRYLLWKLVPASPMPRKVPLDPVTLRACDPTDSQHWTTAEIALQRAREVGPGHGVGFAIAPPYWLTDLDDVLLDAGTPAARWSDFADDTARRFAGAYRETSQSRRGVHLIGRGEVPPHACKGARAELEVYSDRRFCALTGLYSTGSMDTDHTAAITEYVRQYLPPSSGSSVAASAQWTDGPCEGSAPIEDDDQLIAAALRSQSPRAVFGKKASFRQLWEGHDPFGDASRADAALATHLAFWTGKDCARIERLMFKSALVRDKWDREDYMRRTILRAIATCGKVYGARQGPEDTPAASAEGAHETPKTPTHLSNEHLPDFRRFPGDSVSTFGSSLALLRASDVQSEPIRWLWNGYLARGKLHLLAGPAGTGKTTVALNMAATVTQGGLWPDGTHAETGSVLIWSGEDGIADSLKPRLEANGADTERVYFIHGVERGEQKRAFDPATDMPHVLDAARRIGNVALLIVDPVVSAITGDSHKNAEVRRGLQPLVDLAADIGCAVLGITHFTKGTQGRDATERVTGSLAFAAFARVVMCTAKPAEPGMYRRLVRSKSNIGPDGGGFEYDLAQVCVQHSSPPVYGQRVVWGAPITGAATELLGQIETPATAPVHAPALDAAVTFLREELANGPIPVPTLKANARGAGVSWPTVRRAKDRLKIQATKDGLNGGWLWCLPTAEGAHHNQL